MVTPRRYMVLVIIPLVQIWLWNAPHSSMSALEYVPFVIFYSLFGSFLLFLILRAW